jgi:glycosyltransferase involved in cell wall biosynthesis
MEKNPITIIILTYNEQDDISDCLNTVCDWAQDIWIIDSYSTDNTIQIASQFPVKILQNPWTSFAKQREWAIANIPVLTNWILFLDADERLTEFSRQEITQIISYTNNEINGYYIRRKFIFLNRWLKHGGYYPTPELRLFRMGKVRFADEDGGARERFVVDGHTGFMHQDILHIYNKGISFWISKHLKLSNLEAQIDSTDKLDPVFVGPLLSATWIRQNIWKYLPTSFRPILLFVYRYILRAGFLDGLPGFYYCFLHDFWFPYLTEILKYEKSINASLK